MKATWPRTARVLERAESDGRDFLLEHEVYEVLKEAGIAAPRHIVVPAGRPVTRKDLKALGSEMVVVTVVSPLVIHKSDVGGVAFVKADPASVNKAIAAMLRSVPLRYLSWARTRGGHGASGHGLSAKAVRESIRGFLLAEAVDFEDVGFGFPTGPIPPEITNRTVHLCHDSDLVCAPPSKTRTVLSATVLAGNFLVANLAYRASRHTNYPFPAPRARPCRRAS